MLTMLNLEHPSITRTLLTGYPDIYHEEYEPDEDDTYDEKREREIGWMD